MRDLSYKNNWTWILYNTALLLFLYHWRKRIIFVENANSAFWGVPTFALCLSYSKTFVLISAVYPVAAAAHGWRDGAIDGEINAGRGEMKRGIGLTWRCNAPLARDLTGTWAAAAAAASPWAAAMLIASNVSVCQSVSFCGGALILLENKKLSQKLSRM